MEAYSFVSKRDVRLAGRKCARGGNVRDNKKFVREEIKKTRQERI